MLTFFSVYIDKKPVNFTLFSEKIKVKSCLHTILVRNSYFLITSNARLKVRSKNRIEIKA